MVEPARLYLGVPEGDQEGDRVLRSLRTTILDHFWREVKT